MTEEVTDNRSNPNDQIAHAANVLKKSIQGRKVFEAIYGGQKKFKTLKEIAEKTGMKELRVTQVATILFNNSIITRKKLGKQFVYGKDKFYNQYKKKVLNLAGNRTKLSKFPTKYNRATGVIFTKLPLPKKALRDKFITIDEIDSFSKVRSVKIVEKNTPIYEDDFKKGIQKILHETGVFKDWGGEKNDLLTTRLVYKSKRRKAAFGFKGRGKGGVLKPNGMGKNGDQIQRLFESNADVFVIQYWDRISEKVLEQMQGWAQLKSYKEERDIYYGIIDGQDTMTLCQAYGDKFPTRLTKKVSKKCT